MSELQNDSVESEVIEPAEIENQDNGTDLAPVSEAEHEPQPQVDDEAAKQEAINKAINKKHFEAKQAERERDEALARVAAFEEEQRKIQAAQVNNLPEWPDEFDDNFEQKKANYIEAVRKQEAFNAQQSIYEQQQQQIQQQEAQAKAARVQESMVSYANKATELGIKQDELQAAANTVANYGLSDDLVLHILGDSDGPLITKHLAANPQEGYQLAQMSPFSVGSFLDGIKQKASALKPKTSNAPSPATNLQGNGVDPEAGKYNNIKGAKFE